MKTTLLLMVLFCTNIFGQWAQNINANIDAAVNDNNGYIYVAGTFVGTVDFDPSEEVTEFTSISYCGSDIFFAKYRASDGALIWARCIQGSHSDVVYSIAVDESSNIYLTGILNGTTDFNPSESIYENLSSQDPYYGDIFIAKYTGASGSYIWAESFSSESYTPDNCTKIITDNSNYFYVTGCFNGEIDFDPSLQAYNLTAPLSGNSLFIAKYNKTDCSLVWVKKVDGFPIKSYSIAQDNSGNLYITGEFKGAAVFNSGEAAITIASNTESFTDFFIVKCSAANGSFIWAENFGGPIGETSYKISCFNNNLYVYGRFYRETDFNPSEGVVVNLDHTKYDNFLASYSGTDCSLNWATGFGCNIRDITNDSEGNIYLTGSFTKKIDLDPSDIDSLVFTNVAFGDVLFAKYSGTDCSLIWAKSLGSKKLEEGKTILTDLNNEVFVLGSIQDTLDMDPAENSFYLTGNGNFIAKYLQSGLLPVELTSFSASFINNCISLLWQTATEVNNYGFEIQKLAKGKAQSAVPTSQKPGLQTGRQAEWEKVGFVEGAGNSNSPKKYSFTDNLTLTSYSYSYRLKQIDLDGSFTYSNEITVDAINILPAEYSLEQNYPNPFNPSTMIRYQLPISNMVSLKIYDILGREVATLVNEQQA
ncbi:MAG: hypothetical protein GXX85_08450, partial [Ignavibacteria bacterium]|nr:hypothetical protein [Ignavibacteria bacterium]